MLLTLDRKKNQMGISCFASFSFLSWKSGIGINKHWFDFQDILRKRQSTSRLYHKPARNLFGKVSRNWRPPFPIPAVKLHMCFNHYLLQKLKLCFLGLAIFFTHFFQKQRTYDSNISFVRDTNFS